MNNCIPFLAHTKRILLPLVLWWKRHSFFYLCLGWTQCTDYLQLM